MDNAAIIQKIKDLRQERGFSLADVSKRTGFSRGYFSKIENGRNLPPIFTLNKVATALGVDLTYLFTQEAGDEDSKIAITRKAERDHIITELRGTRNRLAPLAAKLPAKNMDPYIFEIPRNDYQVYQHEGEEFYLLLEGRAEMEYGGAKYVFEAGDSVYFDTNVPHSARGISDEPAIALMMVYHYKKFGPVRLDFLTCLYDWEDV